MNACSNNSRKNNDRGSSSSDGVHGTQPTELSSEEPNSTQPSATYDGTEDPPPAIENNEMKLEVYGDADEMSMQDDIAAMLHEADIAGATKKSARAEGKEMKLEVYEDDEASLASALKIPPSHQDTAESIMKKVMKEKAATAATATLGNGGEATALPTRQRSTNGRPSSSRRLLNNPLRLSTNGRRSQLRSQHQQPAPLEATTPPPQSTPCTANANNDEDNSLPNDEENALSTSPPVGDEENTLSPPTLEATLVQSAEATLIDPNQDNASNVPNTEPRVVYMATQVNSNSKKYFLAVLVSLLIGGMATAIAMLVVGNGSNNGAEVDTQPIEQIPVVTVPEGNDTASDVLVIDGNSGSRVDTTQPIEQTPVTTTPQGTEERGPISSTTLNTTIQSLPPPPSNFNPPTNETTIAPTTTATLAPVVRPTDMPIPATLAPTPRPALSPMAQLQSSALELVPNEEIVSHSSSRNVAIYGDTAIVGAPWNNNKRGFALVYTRDNNRGEWSQQAKLGAPDGADGDSFGASVAIHGDIAIVGAPNDEDNGAKSGSVTFFIRNRGIWIQQAKISAPDGADDDRFGESVGIFGNTAIVGAPCDDDHGEASGSAHVFVLEEGIWMHKVKLLPPVGDYDNQFGASVGIFGDTIIVGAPHDDHSAPYSGSVRVFALKNETWTHQAKLLAPEGDAYDFFGRSVGIFRDTIIVGVPLDDRSNNDNDTGENSGSAHLFVLANGIWRHQAKIVAPDRDEGDRFGWSVGVFGDTAIVGSYGDSGNLVDSGSLHLFTRNGDAWDHHAKLLAPKTGVEFGQSVATYNGTVIAGSYSGEVYVYTSISD